MKKLIITSLLLFTSIILNAQVIDSYRLCSVYDFPIQWQNSNDYNNSYSRINRGANNVPLVNVFSVSQTNRNQFDQLSDKIKAASLSNVFIFRVGTTGCPGGEGVRVANSNGIPVIRFFVNTGHVPDRLVWHQIHNTNEALANYKNEVVSAEASFNDYSNNVDNALENLSDRILSETIREMVRKLISEEFKELVREEAERILQEERDN